MTLEELIASITFKYRAPAPIRRARTPDDGKIYLRYSGAHLRRIRAVNGVGRPPETTLNWQRV